MKYYLLLTSALASFIVVNCMEDGGDPTRRGKIRWCIDENEMTEMFRCFIVYNWKYRKKSFIEMANFAIFSKNKWTKLKPYTINKMFPAIHVPFARYIRKEHTIWMLVSIVRIKSLNFIN